MNEMGIIQKLTKGFIQGVPEPYEYDESSCLACDLSKAQREKIPNTDEMRVLRDFLISYRGMCMVQWRLRLSEEPGTLSHLLTITVIGYHIFWQDK